MKQAAGRSVARLAWLTAALAVLAVLAVLVLARSYEAWRAEARRQDDRAAVQDQLNLLRSDLQSTLDTGIEAARALAGVIRFRPEITQEEFGRVAEELTRELPFIRVMAAAPGLVVSRIYPLEANRAALGLDYREVPGQAEAVERARDFDRTVLAGPVDLRQGGRGFIARAPVFLDTGPDTPRRFWGVVFVVADEAALFEASGLGDPGLGLDLALSGRDGRIEDRDVFFGDPGVMARDPVTAEVRLPFGAWQIAALPSGGWQDVPAPWGTRALFALAALAIMAPILAAAALVSGRQRKLAMIRDREAELSRLSWRLEFALAASEVGLWDVDVATDEMFWDERIKQLFGFSGRDGPFSEADWLSILHPEDRDRALAAANAAVAGDGRFVSDYRVLLPDGTVRHVRDMAARYQGKDGALRLVGLVWDVTPDVERQEELNLRRMEAEAATIAKSRFLAAMSHEIRTPMSGVLGLLGLMLDDPLPEKQRERAKIALGSAQSLLQILNDILDFSKLEAKQIRISEENVDVRRLFDEVIELMATPAKHKGLGLHVTVDDSVPQRILADPMRLRQVISNLLSNATKFTDRGEVRIRVGYLPDGEEGELEVEVEDTGIGIAEADLEEIFQDFVQADDSLTRRAGGTGLGLAICRQLVELMGGTLGVRSVPGMGSTFRFVVRAARAPVPDEAIGGAQSGRRRLPPMRVLLAEDHATNQYLIGAYLGAAGHQVEVVENGRDAVAAVAGGTYDVVLMDVQMPEVDGLEATRRIRALGGPAARVPVIALTANALPGDRDLCLEAGMDGYLSKPIDVLALHQALQRFCPDRPAERASSVVSLRSPAE